MKIKIETKVAIAMIVGIVVFSLAYIGLSGKEIAEIAKALPLV